MTNRTLLVIAIFFTCFFFKTGYGKSVFKTDTIIGSRNITNELPGSALRKRAKEYFVIAGKDTSFLQCYFIESKDGNSVDIDIADHYMVPKEKITYNEFIKELKAILPIAAKDFNFKKLNSIFVGRIIRKGDIAIEITNQYAQKFGSTNKKIDFQKTTIFLTHSKLADDFNTLLKPYSFSVHNTPIEHPFFTTRNELFSQSKIETDPKKVPEKIFDCMVWLELKAKK